MDSVHGESTVRLIINGRASLSSPLRRSLQRAARDLEQRNVTVETCVTKSPVDAEHFARDACSECCAAVIAVGGDGTLNQVINGVMAQNQKNRSEVAVGVIPAGTANDFAACIGVRSRDAYRLLMSCNGEQARWLDLGKVQSRYFINIASGGFGAEATRNLSPWLKSTYGAEAYFLNGVRQLLTATQPQAHFQSGDWQWEGRALAFAIGNGRQTGGGCVLCPDALLDDGELDLCIIPAHIDLHKLLTSWLNGPMSVVGKLLSLQNPLRHGVIGYILEYYKELVVRKRVSSLDICLDEAIALNLDGEATEPRKVFSFTAQQQKIKFLIP
ncbi:MAG: YegS/Rv2252/BmrU family lipid kinase [Desulfuromusa sp.]|nr:YegS/Rv2252/BmrU family lipid kinase [Desulfuromusa sp.]